MEKRKKSKRKSEDYEDCRHSAVLRAVLVIEVPITKIRSGGRIPQGPKWGYLYIKPKLVLFFLLLHYCYLYFISGNIVV
jgi:hypothetical protein